MFKRILTSFLATFMTKNVNAAQDYTTTQCAKFGHPEFVYSSGERDLIDEDAQWLRSTLEDWVKNGEKFKAEETLLIGPVILKLEADKGGLLRILEPDMTSIPFKYVNSVSQTLNIIRRQRDTADSLGVVNELSIAPLHLPLQITSNALKAQKVIMMRDSVKGIGTGWLLTDPQNIQSIDGSKLQTISVFEAIKQRPEIIEFLALPDQFIVVIESRKKYEIFKDGILVQPLKDSYLDHLSK